MPEQSYAAFHAAFLRNRTRLYGGVAALVLIVALAGLAGLMHLRQADEDKAAATTQYLASSLQQTIDGLMNTIDVALQASSDEFTRELSAGKLDKPLLSRMMARQQERLAHVGFLRGTNQQGDVIFGAGALSPPTNVADRDYFIRQRDDPNAGLFASKPIKGRIDQQWTWVLARRINTPDGSFGGVVYVGIHTGEIERMLGEIQMASGGSLALRGPDMGLIARTTFDKANSIPVGDKRLSKPFEEALTVNRQTGTFKSDSSGSDPSRRLYSYRRSPQHGFTVIVGIDADAALAQWRSQALIVAGLLCIFALAALTSSRMISRAWQRQDKSIALLEASQGFNEQILAASPIGIVVYEAGGQCVVANKYAAELLGATQEQMLTQNFRQIASWKDYGLLEYADSALASGAVVQQEFRVQTSFGKEAWFDTVFARFGTGEQMHLLALLNDISPRKQQEENTRRLLNEHETILRNAMVGIVYLKQRRIVSCNRRFEELFQYAPGELVGASTEQLFDTPSNFLAYGESGYAALRESRSYSREVMLRRKDGSLFWGAATGCAIDPALPNDGSIWIYADISERKRMETQLTEHQSRLEELVLKRTYQLNAALDAAKLADKSKDEFLANITHELRTPLSAVIGFSSLARPFCQDARQSEYLDKVKNAGQTLAGIIDDLLDLSKIAAGRLELENRTFSLRQLVARSRSMISFKAEEKGLRLVEWLDAEVPDVLVGDSLRLEQILLNLMSNAVKFTAAGRVDLRVRVHAHEAARVCLAIEVADTGIGMKAEEIVLLFKPFSQTDATVTRKFGGTGLGLSICKRLAEMMDGDITVASRPEHGSTFHVRLWFGLGVASDLPAAEESAPEAALVRYRNAQVLVVDDQPFNREVVQGMLAVVGIVPKMATNGQEALDVLAGNRDAFDLVLMDVQMPVMDGLTATREIRNRQGFEQLPIIAMTAHTMTHEREKSAAAGMNDHIGKPFDEASFYQVLAKWIPREKQQPLATPATPMTSANYLPLLHGIDTHAGLALLQGDERRYRHWLRSFIAEAPAAVAQIRLALEASNPEPASMTAHTLKGRTGLLGMKPLYAIAAALEAAIDNATPTAELLQNLERDVNAMCTEIHRGLGQAGSAEPVAESLPASSPPDSVARLIASLERGHSDCDRLIAECLSELADTAWAPCLRQALLHIRDYDYAAASSLLAGHRQALATEGCAWKN